MIFIKPKLLILLLSGLVLIQSSLDDTAPPEKSTFKINLDAATCHIDIEKKLKTKSLYQEIINQKSGKRIIKINGIAKHKVGAFPNKGNPNSIKAHKATFSVPLHPKLGKNTTPGIGYDSGILFSGVSIDPFTAEFFIGSNGAINRAWNYTTLTSTVDLGLDCNNAHVQPSGKYHYHGTPSAFLEELGVDGTKMTKIGYAADGFPIYYKYGYDQVGKLRAYTSGYQLKSGQRPGNGKNAPSGEYDGTFFQDYEYQPGISELDECNGKWGKTPESDHEYYYVISDNFPSVPICFSGNPSKDFMKMRGRRPMGPPPGGRGQRPPRN